VLYTYCIPVDDGAAPNPYWGICTLAICKPAIRRVAGVGDWVVGTGSSQSPIGNIAGTVVYAMRVTTKMSMRDYDSYTRRELRNKLPAERTADPRRRVGDSIYDFSKQGAPLRGGSVHLETNRATDLGGEYVLLSHQFVYFGDNPMRLPAELLPIVKQGQGHRSAANDPYADAFTAWIASLSIRFGSVLGEPQWWRVEPPSGRPGVCAERRRDEGDAELHDHASASPY
jgi:hypothetical protein